ncbi:MAG: hypothetical protein L0Z53_06565 [Acidobacteriales bacterium]|nr:hypothetical protein [Terriglobales bacterium]
MSTATIAAWDASRQCGDPHERRFLERIYEDLALCRDELKHQCDDPSYAQGVSLKGVTECPKCRSAGRGPGVTYYQWDDGSVVRTDCVVRCIMPLKWDEPVCHQLPQHDVLWAWDRSLGAWVHYRRERLPECDETPSERVGAAG